MFVPIAGSRRSTGNKLAMRWTQFTCRGTLPLNPSEPVCHVSFYEADAFARWAGARLPTEFEWEVAVDSIGISGNFLEDENYHPRPAVR